MSSVPLAPGQAPGERSVGALARAVTPLHRGIRMDRPPVPGRLLLLALLGVLLIFSVAGTALVGLADVSGINRELGEVSRAQRHHQDADMMHDALRADVARAEQAASGRAGVSAQAVRRETKTHAMQFRRNLRIIASLQLPPALDGALRELRPAQESYVAGAERMVRRALLGQEAAHAVRADYERAFGVLARAQSAVTDRLATTSAQTERVAVEQETAAERMVVLASLVALTGWLALTIWLYRSVVRLRAALAREGEQRSAANLLQRSLLPRQLPAVPGAELAARSLPGQSGYRVGGDWYDVISLPTGEVGLVVGDVVGHDLKAATTMGQLRNTLRVCALDDPSPAKVLTRVNRAAALLEVVELATCLYAVLDPATLRVRWSSAGHPAPLVSSGAGVGRLVESDPGPPLGATAPAEYLDHELTLAAGDALALYTDGLVERRGQCIDTGLADLAAVRGPHPSADVMCDRLMAALLGDLGHSDDVTLLVLQTQTAPGSADHVA